MITDIRANSLTLAASTAVASAVAIQILSARSNSCSLLPPTTDVQNNTIANTSAINNNNNNNNTAHGNKNILKSYINLFFF